MIDMLSGVAFLGVAAVWNWRYRKVPNALLVVFLLSFLPAAWFSGMTPQELLLRGAVFAATFLVFLMLFALNLSSGGAAKLVAVTTLWLPPPIGVLFCAVCVALIGMLILAARMRQARWIEFVALNYSTVAAVLGISLLTVQQLR